MEHVIIKEKIPNLDYMPGQILAVVSRRGYMSYNEIGDQTFHTDGKVIGCFEVGMDKSPLTHYCITPEGIKRFSAYLEVHK